MKILIIVFVLTANSIFAQSSKITIVSSDIENFWIAFDKINGTKDTVQKYKILEEDYIKKGSAGLKDLMEVRNYTPQQYISAIRNYPKFWKSIRKNTINLSSIVSEINNDVAMLEEMYPSLKPATLYFAIGVFRTGGTVKGNNILIGSEAALADNQTVIHELPDWRQPFYKENSQIDNIALLAVHEYIHTQQKEMVHNLLSMCLYEGIAEFISCKATSKRSTVPAIQYGKAHQKEVTDQFVADLFLMRNNDNWLWSENSNQFRIRDLGYYIGYEIAERYYDQSADKTRAVKELIELDYRNEADVERIVNSAGLFPEPLSALYSEFDAKRPRVIEVTLLKSGQSKLPAGKQKLTIVFSEPLNGFHTGVDFGPLGKDHFPVVNPHRVWSADKRSWTIEADLKPNMKYQILIDNNFRNDGGLPLKPYLIEFETQ